MKTLLTILAALLLISCNKSDETYPVEIRYQATRVDRKAGEFEYECYDGKSKFIANNKKGQYVISRNIKKGEKFKLKIVAPSNSTTKYEVQIWIAAKDNGYTYFKQGFDEMELNGRFGD